MEVSNEIVEDKITANQTLRNYKRRHFNWEKTWFILYRSEKTKEGRYLIKPHTSKENVFTPIQPNMVKKRMVVKI